jgi:mono/diheme cytochrome c family protein
MANSLWPAMPVSIDPENGPGIPFPDGAGFWRNMKLWFSNGPSLMRSIVYLGLAGFFVASQITAQALPRADESRGRLLYETHCIACHNARVHWRAKRAVTDWATLKTQVRYWQRQGGLTWSEADVGDVARYLNSLYYGFELGGDMVTLSPGRVEAFFIQKDFSFAN